MCDSFSQCEWSEFIAQSIQKEFSISPQQKLLKIQVFLGSDQEKKYCWQAQKLVEIIFTGEVAYETKI